MSKICPETNEKVLYPTCLECEDRLACGKSANIEIKEKEKKEQQEGEDHL